MSTQVTNADSRPWSFPLLPADAAPTAAEVLQRLGPSVSLADRTVLITGASAGIGRATLRALASRSARVVMLARDVSKAKQVVAQLRADFPEAGEVEVVECDLSSLSSVSAAASEVLRRVKKLHVLICNAGVGYIPYHLTVDGHEEALAVNHLAHFLLFSRLLPVLIAASSPAFQSRVVSVASDGHLASDVDLSDPSFTAGRQYLRPVAYGQSKTANILFAVELERRYAEQGVRGWAVNPGPSVTPGLQKLLKDDENKAIMQAMGVYDAEGRCVAPLQCGSEEQGAANLVWTALSPELEGKGGQYVEQLQLAKPAVPGEYFRGYAPYAVDSKKAAHLWDWSEKAVAPFMSE
jgi:NAD(P)-dependent dehydrogenase (short-subunit alcohol dehydrogenase family)